MTLAIALPRGGAIATPRMRVRRRASNKQTAQTGVVSRAHLSILCRQGAAGEQKHLPDRNHPRQQ